MAELEMEREKFLAKFKKSQRKARIVTAIIMFGLTFVLLFVVGDNLGWKLSQPDFLKINSFMDIFDNNKVYYYFIITGVVYLIIVLIINYSTICVGEYDDYKRAYRRVIASEVLNEKFSDVVLDHTKGLDELRVRDMGIIDMGTSFLSDDYYRAKYRDISFESGDIETSHKVSDGDGGTDTITDFAGQYYIMNYSKEVSDKVRVLPATKQYRKKENYIEMEDAEFNEYYSVLASNIEDVHRVLTSKLIETLKVLGHNKLETITVGFVGNKVHIANYSYEDMFEFNPIKKLDIEAEKNKIREQLKSTIQLMDMLDSESKF